MRTVSAICFALATAVTASALSMAPSYAQTYAPGSTNQQVCGSVEYSGGGNCVVTSLHKMGERNHDFHDHSRASDHARSDNRME
jgi:hypothetical protein